MALGSLAGRISTVRGVREDGRGVVSRLNVEERRNDESGRTKESESA